MRRPLAAGLALVLASPLLAPAAASADESVGRKVFTEIAQPPCALCHTLAAAGAAGTIGPSLDELKPNKSQVTEAVRRGLGVMPPFEGKLTPEQIEAVAEFVSKSAGK